MNRSISIILKECENSINYTFKNKDYLLEALTHRTYANEKSNNMKYNQRLEFLGDSVLSLIMFIYIQIKKGKTKTGLIDLSIMKNHNFVIGTLGQVVLMGVMMSSASILPSMLQSQQGRVLFYPYWPPGREIQHKKYNRFCPTVEGKLHRNRKGEKKVETLQCKNHSEKGRTNQSPSESGQKIRLC